MNGKKRKVDLTNEKVLSDCYEFLHMVELDRGTISELMDIFGTPGNKKESNYRQVERIKQRCILAGIKVTFDEMTSSFHTDYNSKLRLLDIAEKQQRELPPRKPPTATFGMYKARKIKYGV